MVAASSQFAFGVDRLQVEIDVWHRRLKELRNLRLGEPEGLVLEPALEPAGRPDGNCGFIENREQ